MRSLVNFCRSVPPVSDADCNLPHREAVLQVGQCCILLHGALMLTHVNIAHAQHCRDLGAWIGN